MNILGLIPARGGSKGIPRKNVKNLAGQPLLYYTACTAKASKNLSKVILSSENEEILQLGETLGLSIPFKRPAELAGDTTGSLEVILDVLQKLEEKGEHFDAVCLLQPTSPLRNENLIDNCIRKFKKGNYDSLISVREVPAEFNPHWIFEEKEGLLKISTGEEQIIPRRQDLPKAYHRDGAIYLTKTNVILQQKSLYGKKIGFYDNTAYPYVNIDTPEDWQKAEKLLKEMKENGNFVF